MYESLRERDVLSHENDEDEDEYKRETWILISMQIDRCVYMDHIFHLPDFVAFRQRSPRD